MKRIYYAVLLLLFYCPVAYGAAGVGISSWDAQTDPIAADDVFAITDISDTTRSDDGSDKKATTAQVETYFDTKYPTLATMSGFSGFFNGTFQETFDALVTSDGATITMSLQSTTAGDLTMRFSDGRTALDCTPAKTIALTAGTTASPQSNYIYILQSDKILTKSTTQWPTAEHIKIAYFSIQTAAFVQTYGAIINQNWNDGANDDNNQGHVTHQGLWIRSVGAKYFSGVDGAGTDDYITPYAGGGYFKVSAGVVTQMHRHTVPAVDTQTGGIALCPNYPSDAFKIITDLNDLLLDSTGGSLTGRYYNIIIGGVANKTGEFAPLMVKLPSGSYNSSAGAVDDVDTYTDYAMPRAFNKESSTGFLIARVTIRNQSDTTFTIVQTQDLRGTDGALPAGSTGGGSLLTFPDSQFKVYNNTDPTKIIDLDVSAITTGNTRTIIMADADIDLGALGTASIRDAEDTLTDGANLPDGAAITVELNLKANIASPTFTGTTLFPGSSSIDGSGDAVFNSVAVPASSSPAYNLNDSDSPGTDKDIGGMSGQYVDGADGAENSTVKIEAMVAGTRTSLIEAEGDATTPLVNLNANTVVDGTLNSKLTILTKGAAHTLSVTEAKASYTVATAAMVLSLPAAVAGYSGCFESGQGVTAIIQLTPAAGDYLVVDGARGTVATAYASTAAYAKICFIAVSADDWHITSKSGTWSE